ncbi:MAG TPA: uracil-DNA glycosylase [Chromatiaceae bacterium]|nr:MAG: uracil-DNA glycosylase [Thiohalocapsa sp. PB-PSB1]HBG94721.1 uracil-DNA glycosylase [Chromatiaceae bacterium]HCS90499.1 uracil-DNA glycosylase [Chromatiaceae bacterium]
MNEARRQQYLAAMGITSWHARTPKDAPFNQPQPRASEQAAATPTTAAPRASAQQNRMLAKQETQADPIAAMDWPTLQQTVAGCRACGLCDGRNNTVFGVGNQHAKLMLVGEAPGREEDLKGEPFVGRAGQLLDRMLAAVELKREQIYIANIVKCRPPGNRNPHADEAAACRAYLLRQIELVQPKLLVCLGGVSATNLLEIDESVGRLRQRTHVFAATGTPLLVTYHPSYYLRSAAEKAKGWQDLQQMIRLLRELAGEQPS